MDTSQWFIKADVHLHLHGHGSWRHLSPKIHSHHSLHVWLHDWNHGEALLLLLLLLLLDGHHACTNTHDSTLKKTKKKLLFKECKF